MIDRKPIDNPTEKANALGTTPLERYRDADDLTYDPFTAHIVPNNYLP
jgi:hypothetical protein